MQKAQSWPWCSAGLQAEALAVRESLGLSWQHAASRPRRAPSRALSRDSSFENLRVSQVHTPSPHCMMRT